ncbi:hypothetical protein CPB86DRAFT_786048 [Serendipita vermifera]|nr:hypothetical protein CPB86DRAFT_786048 [Serendipita vermifera]
MPKAVPNTDFSSLISSIPAFSDHFIESTSRITSLWSNYGSIDRVYLMNKDSGARRNAEDPHTSAVSLVIKTVQPPSLKNKGSKDEGHLRKLLSYKVEQYFYAHLSSQLPKEAKVATHYSLVDLEDVEQPVKLVLEDLAPAFPHPAYGSLNLEDTTTVLNWLAKFHGTFWGFHQNDGTRQSLVPPPLEYQGSQVSGVWGQGTYWYLDTRREEHQSVDEDEYGWLLKWADKVDNSMKEEANKWGTVLHGDVKGANIVFSRGPSQSRSCALYDFQYAGIGLVTRDLVYFIGTTVQSALIRRIEQEKELLQVYHHELLRAIANRLNDDQATSTSQSVPGGNFGEYGFETLWRHWEMAIVDWYRFMAGWGFWGNDTWVERRAKDIVSGWDEHVQ